MTQEAINRVAVAIRAPDMFEQIESTALMNAIGGGEVMLVTQDVERPLPDTVETKADVDVCAVARTVVVLSTGIGSA